MYGSRWISCVFASGYHDSVVQSDEQAQIMGLHGILDDHLTASGRFRNIIFVVEYHGG